MRGHPVNRSCSHEFLKYLFNQRKVVNYLSVVQVVTGRVAQIFIKMNIFNSTR